MKGKRGGGEQGARSKEQGAGSWEQGVRVMLRISFVYVSCMLRV